MRGGSAKRTAASLLRLSCAAELVVSHHHRCVTIPLPTGPRPAIATLTTSDQSRVCPTRALASTAPPARCRSATNNQADPPLACRKWISTTPGGLRQARLTRMPSTTARTGQAEEGRPCTTTRWAPHRRHRRALIACCVTPYPVALEHRNTARQHSLCMTVFGGASRSLCRVGRVGRVPSCSGSGVYTVRARVCV